MACYCQTLSSRFFLNTGIQKYIGNIKVSHGSIQPSTSPRSSVIRFKELLSRGNNEIEKDHFYKSDFSQIISQAFFPFTFTQTSFRASIKFADVEIKNHFVPPTHFHGNLMDHPCITYEILIRSFLSHITQHQLDNNN